MHYWRSVLGEVLHKDNKEYAFLFTSHGQLHAVDDLASLDQISDAPKEKRDLRTYYLGDKYPGIYFTKREAESLFWMVHGCTIAETAGQMGLSPRTVEFYVKNMKIKLGCVSKKRLIQRVLETNLMTQLADEGMQIIRH